MKRTLQIVVALGLAGLLLWLTFDLEDAEGNPVPFSTILDHLRAARPGYLIAGMAMGVAHVLVRALRWRTLLRPLRPGVPLYPLFATTGLGYAASLAGGRVGELLRPALLGLREKLPIPALVGTVVVERFLDLVALVVLAAGALLMPRRWTGLVAEGDVSRLRTYGLLALAVGLAVLVVMALMAARRETIERWARARAAAGARSLRGAALGLLSRFLQGADALRRPAMLLSAGFQSLGVWCVIAGGIWLLLLGCGVTIPFAGSFILMPALALGIAVPTPGGAGGYHFMMKETLQTLFGIDPTVAASASLLHHAATWVPMILLALVVMAREGLGIADLSRLVGAGQGGTP